MGSRRNAGGSTSTAASYAGAADSAAAAAVGPCRAKLAECGAFEILTPARFLLVDNRPPGPEPPQLTYNVLAGGALENGTALPRGNGTYLAEFSPAALGTGVLAVYLDGVQV